MPEQPNIAVTGIGVASGAPDQCGVQIALNHTAGSAAEALSTTAEMATKAIGALAELSLDQCEVRTVGFSVQDFFDQKSQKVTAQIGSYQLDVQVRPIEGASTVLAALASTLGNGLQVRGIHLTIRDPEPLKSEARRLAVQDAKRKAIELSEEAGVQLGSLISIEDEGAGSGMPPFRRTMPTSTGFSGASFPIEAGDVSAASFVTLTYGIEE